MTYIEDPAQRLKATQEAQAASAAALSRIVNNPAAVFDKAARDVGVASSSEVARIVGVSPQQWNMWTQGHRAPGYAAIVKWLVAWEAAGHEAIALRIGKQGCCVVK